MHILILAPYPPGEAASQRFRFEQYLHALTQAGHTYEYHAFLDMAAWQILHKPGHISQKITGVLRAFLRRFALMFRLGRFDKVFIHREASHIGPPVFEWFIAKIWRKPFVYDFDDAIWLPNYSEHNSAFHRLKMYGKVVNIIGWADVISAGNDYLAAYAKQTFTGRKIVVNPTTIDTGGYHAEVKNQATDRVVIGWTGTLTTVRYIAALVPVLTRLAAKYRFEMRVISNEAPNFHVPNLHFVKWRKDTEIADLLTFNIGIMPLEDDQWAKGKCGFKALQYMSLGIPAVVSPVGVNAQIVDNGINGFVCQTDDEWYSALAALIEDRNLRMLQGREARKKIVEHYSVQSNTLNFLQLLLN